MATPALVVVAICLALGVFLMLVAAIGVLRFPDFYSRTHPAGKGDTLGQTFVFLGLFIASIAEGWEWTVPVKIVLIVLAMYITNPISN